MKKCGKFDQLRSECEQSRQDRNGWDLAGVNGNLAGQKGKLAGRYRVAIGPLSGTLRGEKSCSRAANTEEIEPGGKNRGKRIIGGYSKKTDIDICQLCPECDRSCRDHDGRNLAGVNANLAGQKGKLAGRYRVAIGPLSGTLRGRVLRSSLASTGETEPGGKNGEKRITGGIA